MNEKARRALCMMRVAVISFSQLVNSSPLYKSRNWFLQRILGERGGSVVECRTPEREVRGSRPTSAVLCP